MCSYMYLCFYAAKITSTYAREYAGLEIWPWLAGERIVHAFAYVPSARWLRMVEPSQRQAAEEASSGR